MSTDEWARVADYYNRYRPIGSPGWGELEADVKKAWRKEYRRDSEAQERVPPGADPVTERQQLQKYRLEVTNFYAASPARQLGSAFGDLTLGEQLEWLRLWKQLYPEQSDDQGATMQDALVSAINDGRYPPPPEEIEMMDEHVADQEGLRDFEHDPVNHPSHYTDHPRGIECIQVTEAFNFNKGNAIKYIWRAGKKSDALVDLEKARWYIDREITRVRNEWEHRDD